MRLRRTRKGYAEPAPDACPQGHPLRGGLVLVGSQHCACGVTHRTHTCRTCDETLYTPPLGARCRARHFDER
ncbi:hypothetical protein I5G81_gp93 [Mycobacterium phage Shandong1]|uniref:Uncharacterized protein n=1 Tax=Mycobacterium phage Shandong1 TaxID=1983447 RepID=A0A1X9SHB9_9CAUD|nr:hypothetical protein I5G81_gp93 [Mycobacterium phage Shandong1]ARQ95532.1 hypothetical protein [Mycobacterium phage Shandong1]